MEGEIIQNIIQKYPAGRMFLGHVKLESITSKAVLQKICKPTTSPKKSTLNKITKSYLLVTFFRLIIYQKKKINLYE